MTHIDDGLVMDNLAETSQAEIDTHLGRLWRNRGPMYPMSSVSIMLNARPDFAKLHRRGAAMFGRPNPVNELVGGLGNLHTYIQLGFEPGILNEVRNRQRQGVTKAQFFDLFMLAQLTAGMRGLLSIYSAVGLLLSDFQDRPVAAPFPAEWSADPRAFRCGLDLTTPELTPTDRDNLVAWYTATLGYVPRSIAFAAKHQPRALKAGRARWEAAFRGALPNQVMPYLLLRDAVWRGEREGLRQAALLGQAWGLSREWVIRAVMQSTYYFCTLDALDVAHAALADLLEQWA